MERSLLLLACGQENKQPRWLSQRGYMGAIGEAGHRPAICYEPLGSLLATLWNVALALVPIA